MRAIPHKIDGGYGWVVVAAGAVMTCVAVGAMFSLAVYLPVISETTGWSRAGISAAMTLDLLVMGVAGFFWGAVSDRWGARRVTLAGSILLCVGLAWASRATTLLEFQLTYGALVGLGAGAYFPPMIGTVTNWFERHRGLAVSLVSVGVGVAPMTISPFASWLLTVMDWRSAQLLIAGLALLLLVPASLVVRPAPDVGVAAPSPEPGPAPTTDAQRIEQGPPMGLAQALRSPQFIILATVFFACCATHAGPIFHTISYAIVCGIAPMAAVTIYSLEGLAGLGGRLLCGVAADRLGVKRVLIAGLLVQAFAAGAFVFARQLTDFYTVSFIFGLAYGGVMPLYAVLARAYFGPKIIGAVFGAAAMVSSLGMALGPLAGGWIYDNYGSYAGMYIGSMLFGLGAAAIAFFFPPLPTPGRHSSVERLSTP